MYDCRGKGREFSFGAELARGPETRTKVSETLQLHNGDMDAPWAWGQEPATGVSPPWATAHLTAAWGPCPQTCAPGQTPRSGSFHRS